MSLNRFAKRRDETEKPIVAALREAGYLVKQQDFPDLVLRHPSSGQIFLMEVEGITKYRKRTAAQLKFLDDWHIPVVRDADAAFQALVQRML